MSRIAKQTAALGLLAAITIGAAAALTEFDTRLGARIWGDPDRETQFAANWQLGAVFAYTSGSVIGHICALIAGFLGTRWWSPQDGLFAGAGIGVVNLATSASLAVFITRDGDTISGYVDYVDPNPLHQPAVLIAVFVVIGAAVLAARLGSIVGEQSRPLPALITLIIAIPVIHLIAFWALTGVGP